MKCDKQGGRKLLDLSTKEPEGSSIVGHGETPLREGSGTRVDGLETGVDALCRCSHNCAWPRECRLCDRLQENQSH